MRDKGLKFVIADSAFKRKQVDARACRLDTGEHHRGLALRTSGARNCSEWNGGRKALRLGHDAFPRIGGSATLSARGFICSFSDTIRSIEQFIPHRSERGYFATKVDDIAALARVAPATVYAVSGGKQGLLRTLTEPRRPFYPRRGPTVRPWPRGRRHSDIPEGSA